MLSYLKLYFLVLGAFVVVDGLWLGVVARGFYQRNLGEFLRSDPNWLVAILFYLVFIAGLMVFAIAPGLQSGAAGTALLKGAFLGLLCYATYDLTNLATLKGWPWQVAVVDIVWGGFLCGLLSAFGYYAGRWLE
jgi:uncharacterized membrane protein